MSAPFDLMNGTEAGNNLMYFFQYSNQVTGGKAVPVVCIAFFLIVLISSLIFQLRFTSRIRFEVSLLTSSFALLGFELILIQYNGLIDQYTVFPTIALFVISAIWVFMSSD